MFILSKIRTYLKWMIMLCFSLYCFFSKPFHVALLLKRFKLLDLQSKFLHPRLHVPIKGNVGVASKGNAKAAI